MPRGGLSCVHPEGTCSTEIMCMHRTFLECYCTCLLSCFRVANATLYPAVNWNRKLCFRIPPYGGNCRDADDVILPNDFDDTTLCGKRYPVDTPASVVDHAGMGSRVGANGDGKRGIDVGTEYNVED